MSVSSAYFNLTTIPDYFPFECQNENDTLSEVLIYIGLLIFLGTGLYSHIFILVSVLWTKRKTYKDFSFFKLFVMDSIASIIILTDELLFTHIFLFVPPLCPIFNHFFFGPSILTKYVYMSMNHARFMKSLAQIFMVFNRMSCVVMTLPGRYDLLPIVFCSTCDKDALYVLQAIAFDTFTVG
ncbi:Protein CBG20981 [Caenorhabditis briggsae]|uniref:Serpentine receptor class gamma n=1 Tax=Caenorhabditis briggsae TaxID=6238 RepID=A8XZ34_CAEBR|nr:Protein CBG20981 [Caenorhabditis briggsae]CAP37901.2 Protein CBG20981 [Caenorhabditis briggsae]